MALEFTTSYVKDSVSLFRQVKKLAEAAMAQVSEEQLGVALDDESNSIAVIVKHMAGNMRSRWTDFLTSDGEKPDRDRDSEFILPPATRAELRCETCVAHLVFVLQEAVDNARIPINPLGLTITYFRDDQAFAAETDARR